MGQLHYAQPVHEVPAFKNKIIKFKVTHLEGLDGSCSIIVNHKVGEVLVDNNLEPSQDGLQLKL